MAWVKLDDQFPEHPKVARAGPLALAMQVAALCYCNRKLTDGFVPRGVARTLLDWEVVTADDVIYTVSVTSGLSGEDVEASWVIDLLVAAGMWDVVPGGYQIHDYHDYQPSKAEVEAEKKQKSKAGKAGAAARWGKDDGTSHGTSHGACDGESHGTCHGACDATSMRSSCPDPDPVPEVPPPQGSSLSTGRGALAAVEEDERLRQAFDHVATLRLRARRESGPPVNNEAGWLKKVSAEAREQKYDEALRTITMWPTINGLQLGEVLNGQKSILHFLRRTVS